VLVIDAYTPEPDQDSGSLRLRYLMDCFQALGYGVTFMADNRAHAGRYTSALQASGIEVIYDPWVESLQNLFAERGEAFDFIMISRHYIASRYLSLLKRYCPGVPFIFDTVDLHYLREERLAELEQSASLEHTAAQTKRSELAVIARADATLVVSPVEQAVLKEAMPEARVHVISNVHEVVGSRRPFAERKDLFFVGGYQHPPNIDAARWFVGEIWPRVREALPDVTFHLIGSKAPDQVKALHGNGVHFHGFVENLEPWLDGCRIAVAPLRYGAGIKGKVNISMSRGQPVVATPMAVEGMFAKAGRDVIIAETAEEFAAAVVRLYRDEELWNRVSANGVENVRRYFSVETARLNLRQLLESLA
jgi:glycosyltransferase involved in cell wall biosynthesis